MVLFGGKEMVDFNPNGVGVPNGNLWGLPHSDNPKLVIIPVRWDATVSLRAGTAMGPDAILAASPQITVADEDYPNEWKKGVAFDRFDLGTLPQETRSRARTCIEHLTKGGATSDDVLFDAYRKINDAGAAMTHRLCERAREHLDARRIVAVLGGDHSTPLGLLSALDESSSRAFSVLHIDAHLDLCDAYEGFRFSHASVMRNASRLLTHISRFVHVGIREAAEDEWEYAKRFGDRHRVFSDRLLKRNAYRGVTWSAQVADIVDSLGDDVYVSFDIDGLMPALCPGTGTPLAGGLEYEQALYLIDAVVKSKRRIIGFDLVEVAPGSCDPAAWETDINAIVACRLLYRLSCMTIASQRE
jgi:agmatinase